MTTNIDPTRTGIEFSISDVAAEHTMTLRALRFYEARGLLRPRRDGRRRRYTVNDTMRVREIQRGTRLGFTITEIKSMLHDGPTGPWLEVPSDTARKQLDLMSERYAETGKAIDALKAMIAGRAS